MWISNCPQCVSSLVPMAALWGEQSDWCIQPLCKSKPFLKGIKELSYEVHGGGKFISGFDRVGGVNQTWIEGRPRPEQTTNRLQWGEQGGGVGRSAVERTKAQTASQRTRATPSPHEVNECERVTWGWLVLYSNFTLYVFLNLNETRCLQEMLLIESPVLRGDFGFCSFLIKL